MDNKTLKDEFFKLKQQISNEIEKIDTTKNGHLQNYLYFKHYPIFSFTESIIILCEKKKNSSAKVLLRSLVDAYINTIYYQVGDSERKLAISVKSGFDGRIRDIKEIQKLIEKYPNLESNDPKNLFNREWLKNAIEWADKERKAVIRGNGLLEKDKEAKLIKKAEECDNAKLKNTESGHFEWTYHIVFRQLSVLTHLNVEGIQAFVSQTDAGKYLFSEGDGENTLIAQGIEICLAFTKDLYENGLIKNEPPETMNKIESLLRRNIGN